MLPVEWSAQDGVIIIEDEVLLFLLSREPSTLVLIQSRNTVFATSVAGLQVEKLLRGI